MLRLYEFASSGNCYKVRLLLAQLGIPYERVSVDLLKKETKSEAFLAKNPNGEVPTLELEDGSTLPESNAILWYLAEGTKFVPKKKWDRAQALRWMFFEQYSHEPYIATLRSWIKIKKQEVEFAERIKNRRPKGYAALEVMDKHLRKNDFFAANRYSIADIALYAYTHVAEEGKYDLSPYKTILAWLERVKNQPKHVTITE